MRRSAPVTGPMPERVRADFGIAVGELRPHPGGFEADAFADGRWFVKWWRQDPDPAYALALTAELAARGLPVPAARRARDGTYTGMHHGRPYAVFPQVAGRPGTRDDLTQIARSLRTVHDLPGVDLPVSDLDERWCIELLRDRADHPWIAGRRVELQAFVDRLEAVIERARAIEVRRVVCHHDLFPHNVLVGDDGRIAALLDWGHALLAPREHDVFVGLCEQDAVGFLRAYGADDLDPTHLEYARLARSLRDLAARVKLEVDREGLETWGFAGLRRVDADLALARPFCAT